MGRSRFATTPRLLGGLVAAGACLALASGASGASVGGDAGDNRLNGSTTGDLLRGLAGSDVLRSLEGNDRLVGGTGNDRLRAGTGQDTLIAGDGNDVLDGGRGLDSFDAGPGDDTIEAADGVAELIRCGPGNDTARVDLLDAVDESCESSSVSGVRGTGADLFWSGLIPRRIGTANVDGSGVDRNLVRAFGLSVFTGVAADNRHVHWVDFATGRIMRARHNGTGVRALVRGLGVASIHDVAVDDQYVYWTNAERSLIGERGSTAGKRTSGSSSSRRARSRPGWRCLAT